MVPVELGRPQLGNFFDLVRREGFGKKGLV